MIRPPGPWRMYWKTLEGLVLWMDFNQCQAIDLSGHGNNGTIYGAQCVQGRSGKALSFDGVDDYCYDEATEVLTLRGWIPFRELTTNDFVATLNPKTNELEYQRPRRLISYYYEGKMVKVNGRHIDLLVTPNHRMFVSVNKGENIWNEYKLLPAEEILNKKVRYKKDCVWRGQRVEFFELPSVIYKINQHRAEERDVIKIPMNDWLEFFGYYISEGCCCKYDEEKSEYSVVIAQSPEKKEKIEECLKRLPFRFSCKDGKFYINNKQLASYLRRLGKAEDKFIPSWIKQLAPDQLKILLDALIYGDGHRNQYYTKSKKLADDIQEIAFKAGFSADVSYWTNRKSPIYCVGIQKTNIRPTIGEKRNETRWYLARHESVDYSGMVYCCEVPKYHIIYVRRNGKAIWSGNCEVPDSDSLKPFEFSIALWIKFKSLSERQKIVNHRGGCPGFDFEFVPAWGNKLNIYVGNDSGDWNNLPSNANAITDTEWHYIVAVYKDTTKTSAFYVDGVYKGGSTGTVSINYETSPLKIGKYIGDYLNSLIDEVRIYNRALSEEEIKWLYEHT